MSVKLVDGGEQRNMNQVSQEGKVLSVLAMPTSLP